MHIQAWNKATCTIATLFIQYCTQCFTASNFSSTPWALASFPYPGECLGTRHISAYLQLSPQFHHRWPHCILLHLTRCLDAILLCNLRCFELLAKCSQPNLAATRESFLGKREGEETTDLSTAWIVNTCKPPRLFMVSSDYNSALVSSLVPLSASIACSKVGKWQEAGWGHGNGANLVVCFLWQSCAIVLFVLHLLHYPWYWVDLSNILTLWGKDGEGGELLTFNLYMKDSHTIMRV